VGFRLRPLLLLAVSGIVSLVALDSCFLFPRFDDLVAGDEQDAASGFPSDAGPSLVDAGSSVVDAGPFRIDATEVTNTQYLAFLQAFPGSAFAIAPSEASTSSDSAAHPATPSTVIESKPAKVRWRIVISG
jgi:hypothetical protein